MATRLKGILDLATEVLDLSIVVQGSLLQTTCKTEQPTDNRQPADGYTDISQGLILPNCVAEKNVVIILQLNLLVHYFFENLLFIICIKLCMFSKLLIIFVFK